MAVRPHQTAADRAERPAVWEARVDAWRRCNEITAAPVAGGGGTCETPHEGGEPRAPPWTFFVAFGKF